jgi:hypothetical protein
MIFRDIELEELYQRWVASCDRTWQRRNRKWLVAIALLCGASAVAGTILTCQWLYTIYSQAPSATAPQLNPAANMIRGFCILAAAALPVGLILGVQRARQVALPQELAAALARHEIFAIELRAIRRALYLTVLPLALIPVVLQQFRYGFQQWIMQAFYQSQPATTTLDPVYFCASTAWWVIISAGYLLCLLEWQAILLSRFPPRANLSWLQAVPCMLPFVGDLAAYAAVYNAHGGNLFLASIPVSPNYYSDELIATGLFTMVAGLALARLLWCWAAAGRVVARWAVITACCLAAVSIPQWVYNARTWVDPKSLMLSSFGRGVYLGSLQPPFSGAGMEQENPLSFDLLAVWLAPGSPDDQQLSEPVDEPSMSARQEDDHLLRYKTSGPGVAAAYNLFLPWYMALGGLASYYAFSYFTLRHAAEIVPEREYEELPSD